MAQDFLHPDMTLFLERRCDWARWTRLRRGPDGVPADELATFQAVLRTAADVCADVAAGAREHWHDHPTLEGGRVAWPPHIVAGYAKLRDAGLLCPTLDPRWGGYGMPAIVNTMILEMIARADASLMTIVGLQAGVAADIEKYGTDRLRDAYLPRLAAGELTGAMDLTEAQAGSDLGGIRTRATREGDRWQLDGEKIFITNGGAPIHLVLARDAATFDESKGTTHGLSLLLCPTTLPDGRANGVQVSRIEEKLGLHGSPTCVVTFEHAEAFLLGTAGDGFKAMLDLMNNARIGVAAQALGVAQAAFQEARDYAGQRVQFDKPILEQPLVKSMLTTMAVDIAAARALLYRTAAAMDVVDALRRHLASADGSADDALAAEHEHRQQLVRLATPLAKYYCTEIANHVTRQAIQVHGGIGFMSDSSVGHHHADAIITTIYEGTSEIQVSFALKEMGKGALFALLDELRAELTARRAHDPELTAEVGQGIEHLTGATPALFGDLQYALLNARRMAEMVIDLVTATELLQQADLAPGRRELAETFVHRRMPAVEMAAKRIASGDVSLLARYDRILGVTG
jgi:alkylation response protein AidB-like acyl-CoA dehydrogenase